MWRAFCSANIQRGDIIWIPYYAAEWEDASCCDTRKSKSVQGRESAGWFFFLLLLKQPHREREPGRLNKSITAIWSQNVLKTASLAEKCKRGDCQYTFKDSLFTQLGAKKKKKEKRG